MSYSGASTAYASLPVVSSSSSSSVLFVFMPLPPPTSTLFPYTTLFRSAVAARQRAASPTRASSRRTGRSPSDERSEEHTSELQSPCNLVCRLLLEKKKKKVRYWDVIIRCFKGNRVAHRSRRIIFIL